jgi:three-Cys-motif partner protein
MGIKIKQEDWIRKYLTKLIEFGKSVNDNEEKNEYAAYTALKLISVTYYVPTFLNVAQHPDRKTEGYDGAVYVDLFAGSGLVNISDTYDTVAGSPICALSANKNNFSYALCVEKDKKKKEALEKRVARIYPENKFTIIHGDCNDSIDKVISIVKEHFDNPIMLTFVDPEGMEIKMKTLKKLSDAFPAQDFMINVGSQGVLRVHGKLKKGDYSTERTWNEYWGEEDIEFLLSEIAERKTVEEQYKEKLSETLGKNVGEIIPINDTKNNPEYFILGYTRSTKGNSGYARALTDLKRRLEHEDRTSVRRMLEAMTGRNKTLI